MFRKDEKFPHQGTYSEQAEFVKKLPEINLGRTVEKVAITLSEKDSPFATNTNEVPAGINVEVYHHSVSAPPAQPALAIKPSSAAKEDSDSDDESEQTTAVVTRSLRISDKSKKEKIVARIATKNDAHSFTLKFNADGTIKSVKHSLLPMAKITKGLFDSHGKPQAGVVVKAQEIVSKDAVFVDAIKPK